MTHKAKKHLGQNFLCDETIIDRIVRVMQVKPDDKLIEIGPGQGALTDKLLKHNNHLSCVEFDPSLVEMLHRKYPNLSIIYKDALEFDFEDFAGQDKIRVIGNLPYNISTPILFHLLMQKHCIQDMLFMLQKEVVDRICAKPGTKKFGRLTVMIQYACQAQHLFDVPAEAFDPRPKVQSAMVKLIPYQAGSSPYSDVPILYLNKVVTCAFSLRRKTLKNALKPLFNEDEIQTLSLDLKARPETLEVSDFVSLALLLSQKESR